MSEKVNSVSTLENVVLMNLIINLMNLKMPFCVMITIANVVYILHINFFIQLLFVIQAVILRPNIDDLADVAEIYRWLAITLLERFFSLFSTLLHFNYFYCRFLSYFLVLLFCIFLFNIFF